MLSPDFPRPPAGAAKLKTKLGAGRGRGREVPGCLQGRTGARKWPLSSLNFIAVTLPPYTNPVGNLGHTRAHACTRDLYQAARHSRTHRPTRGRLGSSSVYYTRCGALRGPGSDPQPHAGDTDHSHFGLSVKQAQSTVMPRRSLSLNHTCPRQTEGCRSCPLGAGTPGLGNTPYLQGRP